MQSVNFSNNRISLVSIFDFNNRCCLFGGDLENDHGEWDKIIEDYHYPKSEVFKIPHHGSKTGYSQEVWMSIVDKPISIITRFNKGKNSLPSEDQVSAIKRESKKVFIIGGRNKPEKGLGTKILEGFKSQAPHLIVKRKEKLGIVKLTYNATGWSCEAIGEVEEI